MNLTRRLDQFEDEMPPLPAGLLKLNRAIARRIGAIGTGVGSAVHRAVSGVLDTTSTATSTVGGQAREAADTFATATGTQLSVVTGQARRVADDVAETADTQASTVAGTARRATREVADEARTGAATVTGQARGAARDVADVGETKGATVAGQAAAQARRVGERASKESQRLVDRATDAVEDKPGAGVPYEKWTRAELYDRAQELDIEGRSGMNKSQLVRALRAS